MHCNFASDNHHGSDEGQDVSGGTHLDPQYIKETDFLSVIEYNSLYKSILLNNEKCV